MTNALPRLRRTLELVQRPVMLLAALLIFVMMFHVVLDVLSKYLLNQPVVGTLEIVSNYYMVAIVFLPLAAVQLQDGHVKVEVFTAAMPDRLVAAFDVFAMLLTLVYTALLTWFVLEEALEQTAIREKIQVGIDLMPVWPARWFAPVGAALFGLAILLSLAAAILRVRGGRPATPEAKSDEWTA
ncbi:MAG: TRAP transporter small permease subunit [Albimonas sp.]|uniref:TRAP transporter small permease subunit n=1 Tax=Albimonas sp. TaxID=1872425 RepID=UPI004056FD4A|tara:strand:+ start:43 stop:594 length:552 start_codon:yes stop_codon:yes gene_type:complete